MAAAATMSTGLTSDLESCRDDVLNFLRRLRWRIAAVEVKRWTAGGFLHEVRKWESIEKDLVELAHEIAQFVTEGGAMMGGTVLIHRGAE
jgi:hypothetical protein